MGSTMRLFGRSVNDLLFDYSLSSSYRSSYVYDPDFALRKDPDIFEIVQSDPVIHSSLDRRTRGIVRQWKVDPPEGAKSVPAGILAKVVTHALKYITLFNQARRRLALAPVLGRTYEYIEGRFMELSLAGLAPTRWWIPTGLKNVDRRRFHWVPEHGKDFVGNQTLNTHLEMFSIVRNRWEPVNEPKRFIRYTYSDREDRVGYGRPLLEAIFFYHYMKTVTFEKISQGIDRWANGIVIGKIDSLRNASTSKTNEDLKNGMKTLLQTARSEHVIVMQDGDDIEVVETSGAGHEISMDFMRYLDEGVERLFNGSILPAGHAGDTGSKARAETESDSSEAFYQPDREDLDEVITRDLIEYFLLQNRPNLHIFGLDAEEHPKFDSEQQKKEDPLEAVQVAQALQQMGVPIGLSAVYKKSGFPQPEPNEELVGPAPMVGMPGQGGDGEFDDPFSGPNAEKPEGGDEGDGKPGSGKGQKPGGGKPPPFKK